MKCNSLRAPSCVARLRNSSRSLRLQNPYSRITSSPSTRTRAASSQRADSTGSRAASSASTEMSNPYSLAIHSSGDRRSADRSCSSVFARVVFPEQGSPQIKCNVAMIFLLRGHAMFSGSRRTSELTGDYIQPSIQSINFRNTRPALRSRIVAQTTSRHYSRPRRMARSTGHAPERSRSANG